MECLLVCGLYISNDMDYIIPVKSHTISHSFLNHRQIDCQFNSLFTPTTQKHQSSALPALCESKPPADSPHKYPAMQSAFLCHDVTRIKQAGLGLPWVTNIPYQRPGNSDESQTKQVYYFLPCKYMRKMLILKLATKDDDSVFKCCYIMHTVCELAQGGFL